MTTRNSFKITALALALSAPSALATNGYFTHGVGAHNKAQAGAGLASPSQAIDAANNPASAILVGGDPGIGKSTLLLQAAAQFARAGQKTIYISGEEARAQVRMRAQRLGLADAPVQLGAETNLRDILTTLEAEKPDLVIIDSIQTMWSSQKCACKFNISFNNQLANPSG